MKHLCFSLNILLLSILLGACGKNEKEDAIRKANFLLTTKKCDEAITVMESAPRDNLDATFLRTLASAYACKAKFDVIELFENNLSLFASPAPMGGTSRFSTSADMTTATDSDFVFLQRAIDTLLYAGGLTEDDEPTTAARAAKFSARDADEINIMLSYLLMVQIGRYFKYYGNTNAAGIKGAGAGANQCFINYDGAITLSGGPPNNLADYLAALGGAGNNCSGTNQGHPDLGVPGSLEMGRLCQGVVLVNSFFNIFPSVLGAIAGTDFPWVDNLSTAINDGKTLLNSAKPGANAVVSNIMSQTNCVTLNTPDDDFIQVYFAILMENLLI